MGVGVAFPRKIGDIEFRVSLLLGVVSRNGFGGSFLFWVIPPGLPVGCRLHSAKHFLCMSIVCLKGMAFGADNRHLSELPWVVSLYLDRSIRIVGAFEISPSEGREVKALGRLCILGESSPGVDIISRTHIVESPGQTWVRATRHYEFSTQIITYPRFTCP